MTDTEIQTYPGTLFSYTAGTYCGVLITENVLKKIAALHHEHLEKVKRVLTDNAAEVFPSMWTLHYPDGKQTHVDYIDTSRTTGDAIRTASWINQPRACHPVFIAKTMAEAEAMADARHAMLSTPDAPAETPA